ncbi:hypothetical protein ACFYWX_10685 [Streptomyces sp. NPDC002888]
MWHTRAHRALKENDVDEAAELMRLSALLDARKNPRDRVPGIFQDEAEAA